MATHYRRAWRLAPLAVLALAVLVTPQRVRADETIHGVSATELREIILARQFTVQISFTGDANDEPYILAQNWPAHTFLVTFEGCGPHGDAVRRVCGRIVFYDSVTTMPTPAPESIDAWNAAGRLGHAFLEDNGDIAIEAAIELSGGMTRAELESMVETWVEDIREYKRAFVK